MIFKTKHIIVNIQKLFVNNHLLNNVRQTASIVNYSIAYPGPTIDTNYFPNTLGTYFWTISASAAGYMPSWSVTFDYGQVTTYCRYNLAAVRLVRGRQSPSFNDNDNGTVTDNSTGLVWAKCSLGQGVTDCSGSVSYLTWQHALQAADNSTLAGYTDWRLPNVKELQTLMDYTKYDPSINTSVFTNTPSTVYYTSSPYAADSSRSWIVDFSYGYVRGYYRYYAGAVRLVRDINTPPVVTKPTVVTNAPSVVTATSARLSGTVNPKGAVTTASFDFGTTIAYGTSIVATPSSIAATASATAVSANKTGLTCGTTYHYRVKAVNSKGTTLGADKAFTTVACAANVDFIITNAVLTPVAPTASGTFTANGEKPRYWRW